jgi:hypothetical protein
MRYVMVQLPLRLGALQPTRNARCHQSGLLNERQLEAFRL